MKTKAIFGFAVFALVFLAASAPVNADETSLSPQLRKTITKLPPVTGSTVPDSTLTGKVVIVTFFASWCPPCLVEFKHLNELRHEFKNQQLTVVAINVFEDFDESDPARLEKFINRTSPEFFVLKGSEKTRKAFGGIKRIPTLFVFDRQGEPVMHFIHKRGSSKTNANMDELRETVHKALVRG